MHKPQINILIYERSIDNPVNFIMLLRFCCYWKLIHCLFFELRDYPATTALSLEQFLVHFEQQSILTFLFLIEKATLSLIYTCDFIYQSYDGLNSK